MPDFFQKLTDMQGSVDDLIRKVPGFKGYFAKEDRRKADRLLREHMVRIFEEQLSEFTRLQQKLIDSGGIMYMERVQRIDNKLRTFIDRIATAAEGYSGLFDAVKIDEEALNRVYTFDHSLLMYQDQLVTGLTAFAEAIGSEDMDSVLSQLDELVSEANNMFKRRVEAMQGMQDSV